MKNIEKYINSGLVEAYVMGVADPLEREQFERMLPGSPELQMALLDFELKVEDFALQHQSPPPPGLWGKIEDKMRETPPAVITPSKRWHHSAGQGNKADSGQDFLSAHEISSTHIRVHKNWRTAFIILVVFAKLATIAAIYYFIQQQHSEKDIQRLEQQVNKSSTTPAGR